MAERVHLCRVAGETVRSHTAGDLLELRDELLYII